MAQRSESLSSGAWKLVVKKLSTLAQGDTKEARSSVINHAINEGSLVQTSQGVKLDNDVAQALGDYDEDFS